MRVRFAPFSYQCSPSSFQTCYFHSAKTRRFYAFTVQINCIYLFFLARFSNSIYIILSLSLFVCLSVCFSFFFFFCLDSISLGLLVFRYAYWYQYYRTSASETFEWICMG